MYYGISTVIVSTHSRPKAAGSPAPKISVFVAVSTHSRPKAAGDLKGKESTLNDVSTHSRPKAAGTAGTLLITRVKCFNTQPPEGGWFFEK